MSIKAMAWAWEQDVPVSTKTVLLALVDRGMTLEEVGSVMGVSKARVWQMLDKLAKYEATVV